MGMEYWVSTRTLTFGTTWAAELSAVLIGRILPPRKFCSTHSCYSLSETREILNADRRIIFHQEWTWGVPSCGAPLAVSYL
jgi:hypothetical protein